MQNLIGNPRNTTLKKLCLNFILIIAHGGLRLSFECFLYPILFALTSGLVRILRTNFRVLRACLVKMIPSNNFQCLNTENCCLESLTKQGA